MKNYAINISVDVVGEHELSPQDLALVKAAREATQSSYAPYSQFNVGAALLLENGEMISGSNQENAASPVSCCAERTALFYANAHYPGVGVKAIAIAAHRAGEGYSPTPVSPCGMCRQALMETEHRYGPIRVLLYSTEGVHILKCVKDLLPLVFTADQL